jgi:hypothetical protein
VGGRPPLVIVLLMRLMMRILDFVMLALPSVLLLLLLLPLKLHAAHPMQSVTARQPLISQLERRAYKLAVDLNAATPPPLLLIRC